MNQLFFVSGLPRSGSTLLMNLLGQNPNHYVTPTSGLIEICMRVKGQWRECTEFKTEGLEKVKHRVEGALEGMLYGYFKKELSEGKICFDKSRGWLQYIEEVEQCIGHKIKIIVPIRNICDILASFEKIYRKRGIEYVYPQGAEFLRGQTVIGRAENLLLDGSVLGVTINRLRDALLRGVRDRLIIVPYGSLTNYPKETMNAIHEQLELPQFDYNPDHVEQITKEDDLLHGMDLHTIKNRVEPAQTQTWKDIFPLKYIEELHERYQDIINLTTPGVRK